MKKQCICFVLSLSNEEIADLKLEGVNLIAEGWANNPVNKAYNFKVFHTIL